MAMAIMTQTRVAAVRYGLMMHEFEIWDEATTDDDQIVKFLSSSAEVGIDTELELIRAKARYLVSKINRDLMYANLDAGFGRILNSTGLDLLPDSVSSHDTADLATLIAARIDRWKQENFSTRPPSEELPIAIGEIDGVPPEALADFRSSLVGILESSKLTVDERRARLRVVSGIRLEPLRDGGRPATIRITVTDARSGAVRFRSEIKTMLSDPVDEDQWRTLGEGVAYRVVGPVLRLQSGRSLPSRGVATGELQLKSTEKITLASVPAASPETPDSPSALQLKLDARMSLPSTADQGNAAN
jgi:hypothetical protein